jgi:hypothetical protein
MASMVLRLDSRTTMETTIFSPYLKESLALKQLAQKKDSTGKIFLF